jgi:hypothetical protein
LFDDPKAMLIGGLGGLGIFALSLGIAELLLFLFDMRSFIRMVFFD